MSISILISHSPLSFFVFIFIFFSLSAVALKLSMCSSLMVMVCDDKQQGMTAHVFTVLLSSHSHFIILILSLPFSAHCLLSLLIG